MYWVLSQHVGSNLFVDHQKHLWVCFSSMLQTRSHKSTTVSSPFSSSSSPDWAVLIPTSYSSYLFIFFRGAWDWRCAITLKFTRRGWILAGLEKKERFDVVLLLKQWSRIQFKTNVLHTAFLGKGINKLWPWGWGGKKISERGNSLQKTALHRHISTFFR